MTRQETWESSFAASVARARAGRFSRGLRCRVATSAFLVVAATACGPDTRSFGDACPDVPLYRLVYDGKQGAWTRVPVGSPDGGSPLGAADLAKIAAAEAHCVTPAGAATGGNVASAADSGAP